jgi:GlpG protein
MEVLNNIQYNSPIILSFFFISFIVLILNYLTNGKSNDLLFTSYRSSIFNPISYLRLFTHIFGHENWNHFVNNFLYILLIGPMIEEKYGATNLLIMISLTATITGIINSIFSKNKILGASGIAFMLIVLSSFVNISTGKIPLTLILICLFYLVNEVLDGLFKKDNISHLGHLIGAICGIIYGLYIF